MHTNYDRFKPIRTFGYVLTVAGCLIAFLTAVNWYDLRFDFGFRVFAIFMTTWHLLTGFGIILRKFWDFYLMKYYLYILFLVVPIGTLIANKILNYIRDNEIRTFFIKESTI